MFKIEKTIHVYFGRWFENTVSFYHMKCKIGIGGPLNSEGNIISASELQCYTDILRNNFTHNKSIFKNKNIKNSAIYKEYPQFDTKIIALDYEPTLERFAYEIYKLLIKTKKEKFPDTLYKFYSVKVSCADDKDSLCYIYKPYTNDMIYA